MTIYSRMLDMSDVGLGGLTESRLLTLFGNYNSLCMVDGLNTSPSQIVGSSNRLLYPAYYMTHLHIPLNNLIDQFVLWDQVDISVEIKKFGANIIETEYSFDKKNQNDSEDKTDAIKMKSNSIFVVDATFDKSVNRTSSVPKLEYLAPMEKIEKIPPTLKLFKDLRKHGYSLDGSNQFWSYNYKYAIVENRDADVHHGVIFSKFTEIMNLCKSEFLFETFGLPRMLSSYIHIHDRETYYYSNCFVDDEIECKMKIEFEICENKKLTNRKNAVTPYWINTVFELYNARTHSLILLSKAKEIISLALEDQDFELDISRILKERMRENG